MTNHRIISLLPSTTEIIFALGAGDYVVGVTHECDFPPEAKQRTHCTGNLLPPGLSAKEIDEVVSKSLTKDPHSIYHLDTETVRNLRPTIIVTQSLCAVCAVPEKSVLNLTCTLPYSCKVISPDPHCLEELFASISSIGKAIGFTASADKLVESLRRRLRNVESGLPSPAPRPRVVVLEWPDPPYAPGHWVPDMIEAAGGVCVLGESGQKSKRETWETMQGTKADIIVSAFCGYNLEQNERECDKLENDANWIEFTATAKVYATNASAYFSRPGNRLIDGTEMLAFIIHGLPQFRPPPFCASLRTKTGWMDLSESS